MTPFVRASRLYDPAQGPQPHVYEAARLRWKRDAERGRSA